MIIPIDKNKALNEFKNKYIKNNFESEISIISETFKNNEENIQNELLLSFKENCKKAKKLQDSEIKGKIKFIYFSFLRTNLMENKGVWRVDFFDGNWFMDSNECSCEIEFSWVYERLFKYMDELMEKRKEFRRAISEMDIESIKLEESNKYHSIAVEILANLINDFIDCLKSENVDINEDLMIFAGEYMDDVFVLYNGSRNSSKEEED